MEGEIRQSGLQLSNYPIAELTLNLGYLPGGTLGLSSLVGDLHKALPFTLDLQPAWQKPILNGINSLSDFGAIIVFTDSAEITRSWVEQVKPALNSTPLIVLVSAQAAPMIQPYYDSGQVDGYIAGINGSLAYEQLQSTPGSSSKHFGSFQATLLVLSLLIFIGGLISLVLPSPTSQKRDRGNQ